MTLVTQERKKFFSSFTYREAFKQLGVNELQRWTIAAEPVEISDFFRQRLDRLQRFDLESLEVSKTLLIDAICEEGLEGFDRIGSTDRKRIFCKINWLALNFDRVLPIAHHGLSRRVELRSL